MAADIPTTEPLSIMAGTTWEWIRDDLDDYLAPTWTLKYYLLKSGTQITLTAAAYLTTQHKVLVAKATTAAYSPGTYTWIAVVDDGTTATEVDRGTIEVLPDLSATLSTGYDTRSHAKTMLDAIEATLEGRASSGQLDIVAKAIADKNLQRDPNALRTLRREYLAEYKAELAAERIARGQASGNKIKVKFV